MIENHAGSLSRYINMYTFICVCVCICEYVCVYLYTSSCDSIQRHIRYETILHRKMPNWIEVQLPWFHNECFADSLYDQRKIPP